MDAVERPASLDRAERARAAVARRAFQCDGVTAVGLSFDDDDYVVRVRASDPDHVELPDSFDGFPVEVVRDSVIRLHHDEPSSRVKALLRSVLRRTD